MTSSHHLAGAGANDYTSERLHPHVAERRHAILYLVLILRVEKKGTIVLNSILVLELLLD